jgi:hypothetical protein
MRDLPCDFETAEGMATILQPPSGSILAPERRIEAGAYHGR